MTHEKGPERWHRGGQTHRGRSGTSGRWWERHLLGDRPPYGLILVSFLAVSVVLTIAVTLAAEPPDFPDIQDGPAWLDSWFKFDAGWYYRIANEGYSVNPIGESTVAFFPTYPVLVHLLGLLIGDYQIAGTIIAVVAGMAAVCLFAAWVWTRLPRRAGFVAVALMMLYPYSFFLYGAMYSDSAYLLVVVGSFLLLEKRMYWTAGLVGIAATAGRPVGIAVTVGLVLRMLELQVQDQRSHQPPGSAVLSGRASNRQICRAVPTVGWRQLGVLSSGIGLAAWCGYLWVSFNDPLIWIEAQAAWGQGSGLHTWFKITYFDTLIHGNPLKALSLTGQLVVCALAVALMPTVWRRFGWGYLCYCAVTLGIPLIGTKDFYGTGRYVLVAFPIVAVGAALLVERRRRWVIPVLVLSAIGLVFCACLFAMGLPVS